MGLYEIEATIECRSQVLVTCNLFGTACVLWLVGDWGSSHRTAMVIDGKSSCPYRRSVILQRSVEASLCKLDLVQSQIPLASLA
jgi:hypothetical protein